ncbi:hypothetical protein HOO68_06575 [Candidatus Gracilibacteria bacterium]|nr:hypothetical protein [Candidatus Gracilibacteria bacterium]
MKKIFDTILIQEKVFSFGIESIYNLELIILNDKKEVSRKELGILDFNLIKYFTGAINIGDILLKNLAFDMDLSNTKNPPEILIGLLQFDYHLQKYIKDIHTVIHPIIKINELRIFAGESVSEISINGSNGVNTSKINTFGKINEIRISGIQNIELNGIGNSVREIILTELKENQSIKISGLEGDRLSILNIDNNISNIKNIKALNLSSFKIKEIDIMGFPFAKLNFLEMTMTQSRILGGYIVYANFQKFFLNSSSIIGTHLSEVSFPKIQQNFLILDSIIQKNIFSNIEWNSYFSESEGKYIISFGGLKETYRMIKYQYDEIGNKTEANKFYAKEMEYHLKSLKEIKDWKNYGIALIQKEVSDFGQDWVRALSIYFIVCLLGFNIAQLGDITLNWILDKDLFQSGTVAWNEFVRYLNLLPKTDEVPGLWYLLVSIVKLLLVYQVTVALRRISQR